jgi:hypothetical protein
MPPVNLPVGAHRRTVIEADKGLPRNIFRGKEIASFFAMTLFIVSVR